MLRTIRRFQVLVLCLIVAVPSVILAAPPPKPAAEATRFDAYAKPDGVSYFALSLMPQTAMPPADSSDIVVLIDTSASQMGPYREKGLEMLRGLLATLGDKDRVKLVAVDVNAVPLTNSFVAPRGKEIDAAMQQLQNRVPLGSTDLEAAFTSAAQSYQGAPSTPRAAVYIGDGQSKAKMVGTDVPGLIDRLVKNRIAIHSFAVGPEQNIAVLAALANQTGGVVVLDGDKLAGREAGAQLSRAMHEPIVWCAERKLPASFTEVYPVNTPPLRADRDTILLGKGSAAGEFAVEISGEAAGKPVQLRWTVKTTPPDDEHAYLAQLVDRSKADGGYSLPTLGSEGLWEAKRVLNLDAHALAHLGRQAAAGGDPQQAKQFIDEAMRRDPNNPNALVLKRSLDSGKIRPVSAEAPASNETAQATPLPAEPKEGDLLESVEQMQRVIQQQVMTEATVEMSRARDRLAADPGGVLAELKLLLDRVLRVPQLTSDQRSDLRNRITSLLEQATQRQFEKEIADVQREQNLAQARERERLLDNLVRKEDQLKGLMDRFNALMEQGYENFDQVTNEAFRAARRDAADEFRRTATNPYGREPVAAYTSRSFAQLSGYYAEGMAVRDAAERGYMDSLHLVDVSHIPFPDEPPIVYPSAEIWRRLTERREKWKQVDLASSSPTEQKILKALNEKTTLDFPETPLNEAMNYIKDKHGIEVQLDFNAMKDAAPPVDPSTPVTLKINDITLRSALKLILSQYNLTYIIKDEVLQITTKDKADAELSTKVYPVGDLVIPIQSIQPNSGQLGGGFGGGVGGGGGGGGFGGGGGGFGGGGGGFGGGGQGGFGGGGFGGGGFNLPAESGRVILPAPATGGALAVGDDPKSAVQQPVQKKQAQPVESSDQIVVKSDVAPDKFWNDYFAALPEPDEKHAAEINRKRNAAVREVVKELMNDRKFDHVTALINAALRHGYAQPWMYEALALAMQAAGQPKAEIERALMSAVDFANTPSDLMNVAVYMARIGLDGRALKLLRQASALEPFRHEPYLHGLRIAQRLNDVDGIRWACLGVLSQAWPNDKKEIVDTARFAADALLERLDKEGQTAQVDDFRKALHEALMRDCVVKVTWTGNADVDLIVLEPTGAMCSSRNPRTAGGGVMLGDSYAKLKSAGGEGSSDYSEQYVLPQGFSGQYKMLVRRIWGQVATGKVTVDVFTHYGTPQMVHIRRQIPVSERDAQVIFDLADGRRKESLDQAKLANAAANQVAVNRSVLAQQLAALENSSSGGADVVNPFGPGGAPGVNPAGFPFFRRGAVGYQPQITTLSAGAMMQATAVVSADRRYVRISAVPFFSSIGPINTFNFASGQGGTQNATGGGGTGGTGTTGGGF